MSIAGLLASLALCGFFAGSETAFVVADRIRNEVLRRQGRRDAALAHQFLSEPERFIFTSLIGTNIATIAFSSLAALFLEPRMSGGTIVVVSSAFLLVFAEILPKTLFRERADGLIRRLAYPLRFFEIVLYPLNVVLKSVVMRLLGTSRTERKQAYASFSRKDFAALLRESHRAGAIERHEHDIITRLFRLVRRRVRNVMVPRTEIVALSEGSTIEEAEKVFRESGFSRLPIYRETLDQISGVLQARDLLSRPESVADVTHKAIFVPETKSCYELLLELRSVGSNMAIVVDEHGGTSGLITIEDLVEELLGEIRDEHDDEQRLWRRLPSGEIFADGRTEIDELNSALQLGLPTGDYTTIAGLVLHFTGKIPRRKESLVIDRHTIEIVNASKKRVKAVKIRRIEGGGKGT